MKPNDKYPQGGIVKQEAPIHISNLNPLKTENRCVLQKINKEGKLVRISKRQ
jgi:large subunit ribosomal protein L24